MVANPRWLEPDEQKAWRGFLQSYAQLTAFLGRELTKETGLSMQDYAVLVELSESPEGIPKPAVGWGRLHLPIKDASRACVVCRRAEPAFPTFSCPPRRPRGARQCVLVTRSEANGIRENNNRYRTVQACRPVGSRNSS